jgi:hypothetical protein
MRYSLCVIVLLSPRTLYTQANQVRRYTQASRVWRCFLCVVMFPVCCGLVVSHSSLMTLMLPFCCMVRQQDAYAIFTSSKTEYERRVRKLVQVLPILSVSLSPCPLTYQLCPGCSLCALFISPRSNCAPSLRFPLISPNCVRCASCAPLSLPSSSRAPSLRFPRISLDR